MKTHNMPNNSKCPSFFVFHVLLLYLFASFDCRCDADHARDRSSEQKQSLVGIGVVADLNSPFGTMINLCMDMAISDFYSAHPDYKTRLQLHKKDAKSVVDANIAVLELMKHGEVLAILGPQGSAEEAFAAAVGESVGMPIISFTARSSALSYAENPYFVRTTVDDTVQAQALAAICKKYEWHEVVMLYEDTVYGNHFLSHVIKVFQDVDIGRAIMISIPTSAEDSHILNVLVNLKMKRRKVFLVHVSPALGQRLFDHANAAEMMSQGYAWVITDSLSIFLNSFYFKNHDSIDGVLGLRPYVLASKDLVSFQERWKRIMLLNKTTDSMELNIYGLWAYDAVTAIAMAVENTRPVNSSLSHLNTRKDERDKRGLNISSFGPRLLSELSSTKFRGLTGDFQLIDGNLKPSAIEIFNVYGTGERTVGFWTPERGIIRELSASGDPTSSTSMTDLRKVMWPGDSVTPPMSWTMWPGDSVTPPKDWTISLKVGVPWRRGFKEFVDVTVDSATNHTHADGFAIGVFLAALKQLPFHVSHEYVCYNENSDYSSMLRKIPKEYDMVVADTTIWAPRASYVDFSLPYSEAGVVMVVKNKKSTDMWIFIKPLRWDLWLAIIVASIFMGAALHILEQRVPNLDGESVRLHAEKPGLIYWYPIAILAFPERNMVSNNWSVFVLVCWLFMAFILMQSFTASLSAFLTVDQLNFALCEEYNVGIQEGSFMADFLTNQLHISKSRLKTCTSFEEFHDAMSKGSQNGGIDAIFDQMPYMKLFLQRYESQYKMAGPTYRTGGLGFAFQMDSPLVAHFSRAILNVTEGAGMSSLELEYFGSGYSSQDPQSSVISQGTSSLTLHEFAGLFLLVGSFTLLALFCSGTTIGRKITDMIGQFLQKCFNYGTAQVNSVEDASGDEDATHSRRDNSPEFAQEDSANAPREEVKCRGLEFDSEAAEQDGDGIEEMRLNDEVNAAQDDGVRVENHGLRNSTSE